jgi:MGT family glycosyltransferase
MTSRPDVPSRVLFTAWPFPGHLFPQIAVAHALRRQGHDVAFYTGAEGARIVAGEGFACYPFRRVNEEAIDALMRGRPADPWRVTRLPRLAVLLRRWLLDTVPQQVEDLEAVVADWLPSVIATDPTLWAPILVLGEKHRLPVAVCSFVPACMVPGRDAPLFGPGLPHAGRGSRRVAGAALKQLARITARLGSRTVNAIRLPHGLPPLRRSVTEHTGQMPLYLVPSAAEFDYARLDLPPSVQYVGPLLWNRPRTQPAPQWLAQIDPHQPCVHVSEGTVHVGEPFLLKAAIDGLAGLPMQVVATTGGHRSVQELRLARIPGNVRVERWIPHTDLMPRVNLVVTTGGAGTVLAALAAGVPLVIVPTEWDKPEVAQRVVESGAGLRLAPQRCTPQRLRAAVREVLEEPRFREAAQHLARIFAQQGGPERAADLLVALDRRAQHAASPARRTAAATVAAYQGV